MWSQYRVTGLCHIDNRGTFRAKLTEDKGGRERYYTCNDPSLTMLFKKLYNFLMSTETTSIVSGRRVAKTKTPGGKIRTSLELGVCNVVLLTTRRPATAMLIMELPFHEGSTGEVYREDVFEEDV